MIHILKYIEFLVTANGKGLYLIFIGILLFDSRRDVDLCTSIVLCLVGLFNIILCCIALKRDKAGDDYTFKQENNIKEKQNMDIDYSNENESLLENYDNANDNST